MRKPIDLLTPSEMSQADARAIAAGVPGIVLMERAGQAVAEAARKLWKGGPIAVLAGPGSNGGDGFVAARILRDGGYQVTVFLHGERGALTGDAAEAARRFPGVVRPAEWWALSGMAAPPQRRGYISYSMQPDEWAEMMRDWETAQRPGLIIDALYGAGVRLPLSDEAARLVAAVSKANGALRPVNPPIVLAVDLPSGVDGATGAVSGAAVWADATITFHRLKPGHLLLPGRAHCGAVTLVDIGLPARTAAEPPSRTFANRPTLWQQLLPAPQAEGHKYTRGHVLIVSGPATATGAARLAASAALRVGAGLVSVASQPDAVLVNAGHLTAIMVRAFDGPKGLSDLLADRRVTAAVIGPGLGAGADAVSLIEAAIAGGTALVLDADALSAFAHDPARLSDLLKSRRSPTVITPHDGEFARIFPDLAGSRLDRARAAADQCGAIVVLKGADTVVAAPGGLAAIADNAPPTLATAGSGDTLAGLVAGLLAQGMPVFAAAAAAVFIHGEAARAFGPGLIAEDLADEVPTVLARLG